MTSNHLQNVLQNIKHAYNYVESAKKECPERICQRLRIPHKSTLQCCINGGKAEEASSRIYRYTASVKKCLILLFFINKHNRRTAAVLAGTSREAMRSSYMRFLFLYMHVTPQHTSFFLHNPFIWNSGHAKLKRENKMNRALGHLCAHIG